MEEQLHRVRRSLEAFGYARGTIALHYAALALAPILAGTVAGTVLGLWLADLLAGVYARFYQFPDVSFVPDWSVVAAAFLASAGAALAGALGAVRRAASLPPAEAMRPEAPPDFRPGPLERLGLQRLLRSADRIIVRSIERRPGKAALSTLGIAFAAAIVIVGWWMFDAVDVIKRIQFEEVDRYDVMVMFQNPAGGAARWELERLDGVRLVEPFRAAAVRLVQGHRRERAVIMGVPPGAELRRSVDRHLVRREVPAGGLLLNDVLARETRSPSQARGDHEPRRIQDPREWTPVRCAVSDPQGHARGERGCRPGGGHPWVHNGVPASPCPSGAVNWRASASWASRSPVLGCSPRRAFRSGRWSATAWPG
jgi:hypothetical protein